ncbi:MAG: efflux RND transporter periplasmic adaptor subunit [Myxococcota bacterium]|jgi:multidrug efflux system membrane fusion protein|nr:efflux RND transporter periplasmic adaptor subunit [Myxococcota bacterium]
MRRLVFLLPLVMCAVGCSADPGAPGASAPGGAGAKRGGPAPPVHVEAARVEDLQRSFAAVGIVESPAVVAIRPQVGGLLQQVAFREGQDVQQGALLFVIDPRPYAAAVRQAEAALQRDRAQLQQARTEEARYAALVEKDYVARERHEQLLTQVSVLEAAVQGGEANLQAARLQLSYCRIHSPLTGRAGQLQVDEGNVVRAGDGPLVTIQQLHPVEVAFALPETLLGELRQGLAAGELTVTARVPGAAEAPLTGEVGFIDPSVDRTSATVVVKATFANEEGRLWPGLAVDVRLGLAWLRQLVTVPEIAVQQGQAGSFVYVVADGKVELRPVQPGLSEGGRTAVPERVAAGEVVVTDGFLRLRPGVAVQVLEAAGGRGR